MIPIARPDLGPEEVAAVTEVLTSGMIAQGRKVAELEARWAEYCGVKHAIALSNGTVALMAIFAGLGLGPGDEVITVSHTFAATANAILFTGATPVFVDIEPDTYLIDAGRIEAAITQRTRAIVPVHLFGLVADMDMISAIADRHGLAVVEDACQAHGATFRGRRAGSFGHGAFSLYATKNMTTAEGGFVTTNDDRLADWLRLYRNQGMRSRYQFEMLGYNFRLTDLAASIGLVQLNKLERNTARRQAIAATYDEAFAGLQVGLPVTPEGRTHVFHQYTLRVGPERDAILAELRESGVGADVYYPLPVHRQAYIMELGLEADLPVTDAAAAETIALPMFPALTADEQRTVIEAVRAAVLRHGAAPLAGAARGHREQPAAAESLSR
ncbi:MAG TPA: DegT/DnrJ/EryC1/StrS family aminotransferase [Candidatus Saccharimonadales bacterium]|nr:DegT/DnrJ/EryC1/StrS family aminotransferase [Candidatus Saccharimonadales bacterium]